MSNKFMPAALVQRSFRAIYLVVALLGFTACSSSPTKPPPTALQVVPAQTVARPIWNINIGQAKLALQMRVIGNALLVANSAGVVTSLDGLTGKELWQVDLGEPLAAGVGGDGKWAAVVTQANELVVLSNIRERWRHKLSAQAYTAPFVAGERVFVLTADRAVTAFDAQTGAKLWQQTRPSEPLVLSQPGVMLAVGDTLVVGFSGRLVGLNPLNGSVRWEVPLALPRGIDDVERLADLVGPASRVGGNVCARAFQASVACVDAQKGSLTWTKPAHGMQGLHGDEQLVLGTEADSKVFAWRRGDGEMVWNVDSLRFRNLSAPLLVGRALAVGDFEGWLHFLSAKDGSLLNRLATDGSAIVAAPVLVAGTVVVVTANGGVFGFSPE